MSRTTRTSLPPIAEPLAWFAAIATLVGALFLPLGSGPGDWSVAAALAALAVGTCVASESASRVTSVSLADIPTLVAMLVLPVGLATLVGLIAGAAWKGRLGHVSRLVNMTVLGVPVMAGALVFDGFRSMFGVAAPLQGPIAWFLLALVACAVNTVAHFGLNSLWMRIAYGVPPMQYVREVAVPLAKGDPYSALLAVVLVEMVIILPGEAKLLPVLLGIAGVVGMWIFTRGARQQMTSRELKDDFFRAIFVSFARLLEMKDPDTARHSARVALYSREIAQALGLTKEDQSRIHLAGLLHDVGKVGVPDEILLKPGRLSDEERQTMERHSRLSAEAIAGIPGFGDLTRMVYAHHERLDGSGYPEGTSGPEVPLGARIIGVADTFEALTSDRPYRAGRSAGEALEVIDNEMHLFDPFVVDALRRVVKTRAVNDRHADVTDFAGEWSRAAKYLDVRPGEEPFVVPPEHAPSPISAVDIEDDPDTAVDEGIVEIDVAAAQTAA